ncbi:thiol:disulfide interchange protein DsbG [Stenotrophomonas sp. SAU14A_NAIMI4_5]|uniref:thiol:disulfide interchange protein DsbG n=1 Tax=Stenotrophomonas sp. SAU14A_NAIMI4_5 TaxID=2072413 RepID=UPI000D541AF7|nr:thiol:disulfide interchange protein DsbG [Stenotrophomonas sp. SAU14A_NAIMI4_5]AWH49891.1 thiol:disulfide interchange protein DsbG [Stenotrophomonas sp. SAU14A_NAIMI4_5]
MLSISLRTAPAVLILPVLLAMTACSQAQTPPGKAPASTAAAAPAAGKGNVPAVLKGIEKHGFEVVSEFDAPGGLRGFAGVVGGQQPAAAYVTADGKHVLVGSLFDAEGNDVAAEAVEKLVAAPMSAKMWSKLESSAWVRDGKADAPRVVYTFSDANCPYCHKFWEAARPWVDAGKVQLRHIMVGVIREDSPAKAAAILSARDPSAALMENEHQFDRGGIKPLPGISREVAGKLDANQVLMVEMGFQGTPGILFQDEHGNVERRAGLPQGDDLLKVLGPR